MSPREAKTTSTKRRLRARPRRCSATPTPRRRCSRPIAADACRTRSCSSARRASARRRLPTAWRVSCSPIPIRRRRRCGRNLARRRSRASGRAPHRRPGAGRPAHSRAHAQRKRRAAPANRGRRRAPHRAVLRLDGRRGRLAHRHRRCGRRTQPLRRQCAAQGAGRAAAARAAAAGQPFGRARAGDVALALPHRHACGRWRRPTSRQRVAAATGNAGGRSASRGGGRRRRRQRRARAGVPRRGRAGAAPARARPA